MFEDSCVTSFQAFLLQSVSEEDMRHPSETLFETGLELTVNPGDSVGVLVCGPSLMSKLQGQGGFTHASFPLEHGHAPGRQGFPDILEEVVSADERDSGRGEVRGRSRCLLELPRGLTFAEQFVNWYTSNAPQIAQAMGVDDHTGDLLLADQSRRRLRDYDLPAAAQIAEPGRKIDLLAQVVAWIIGTGFRRPEVEADLDLERSKRCGDRLLLMTLLKVNRPPDGLSEIVEDEKKAVPRIIDDLALKLREVGDHSTMVGRLDRLQVSLIPRTKVLTGEQRLDGRRVDQIREGQSK